MNYFEHISYNLYLLDKYKNNSFKKLQIRVTMATTTGNAKKVLSYGQKI